VEDVHPGVLLYREDQTLAVLYVKLPDTFYLKPWHASLLVR
jgi:hypothetical protein